MKAAIFEKPGIENLKISDEVEQPKITDHDVLIRVKMAGVNPFDHITISGTREIKSLPHIPGAETSGERCFVAGLIMSYVILLWPLDI